jgi:hypothetical protein
VSAPFSDAERDRILYFLGYPNWERLAQSIQLGFPSGSQPFFLVQDAFNRISDEARESARRVLCQLEATECQIADSRSRLKATQIGAIHTNQDEGGALRVELHFWQKRLADVLGVAPNPYSQMSYQGMGGGMNAKVLP